MGIALENGENLGDIVEVRKTRLAQIHALRVLPDLLEPAAAIPVALQPEPQELVDDRLQGQAFLAPKIIDLRRNIGVDGQSRSHDTKA